MPNLTKIRSLPARHTLAAMVRHHVFVPKIIAIDHTLKHKMLHITEQQIACYLAQQLSHRSRKLQVGMVS